MYETLNKHANDIRNIKMRDLFSQDSKRAIEFSLNLSDIFIDYSKNLITKDTIAHLIEYADEIEVMSSIQAMFNGEKINSSEDRSVLHTALRSKKEQSLVIDGIDVIKEVHTELDKISHLSDQFHSGKLIGGTGKQLDTVINVGIGGSNLGPKMVVDALDNYRNDDIKTFYISNIDDREIQKIFNTSKADRCLLIISSKSFSTAETLCNANTLKQWLVDSGCKDISNHLIAVTANRKAAIEFGVNEKNIFKMWDWVGGRFSLWSAAGLSIALSVGHENFRSLLNGANELDNHFRTAPLEYNAPVILALLDFWYSNFMGSNTHAYVPYDESLRFFPDYLSQLFMESNGKSVNKDGKQLDYNTSPVSWGGVGTNAQHAFFQLLHQGSHLIPVDFLAPLNKQGDKDHHRLLLANCLAQSQALMVGEESTELQKYFPGNKPSITILYNELTPKVLGNLIALYEHRTFIQGLLWQINSFDQFGVELGKKLAANIYHRLKEGGSNEESDSSTNQLIDKYRNLDK